MKTPEPVRWPQFLVVGIVTIASFTTCMHTAWPTPFLPKLLSDDYPFDVTSEEASYITIISPLGNVIGGFVSANLIDVFGRKRAILSIAVPQTISFLLISLSNYSKILLYVARFVGGLGEGATFAIIPLYIAEVAEKEIRGKLGNFMAMAGIAGMVFVNLVGSYLSILISSVIFLIFPIIFLVSFWKMPESPYYLLMKGRTSEAETVLKFLRRRDVSEELSSLTNDVKRQMEESGSYRDIFSIDSNRKAFLLIVAARIVQQFTGATAFLQYAQLLFKDSTDALEPQVGASILLIVQLSMTVLSSVLIDKWGRRPLLLFSSTAVFLDLILLAIYFHLKDYLRIDLGIDWFPLLMMILFIIVFTLGLGTVVQVFSSEIFSASIKSKAISLTNISFALSMMATTKYYQVTVDAYGLTVPYYSFAICTLLGIVCFYVFLPETKGKSLEEIQQFLKSGGKE